MVDGNSVHFNSIKIEGYRGRNFELKMYPGENTVFIMDGNTGKTTTIELLRWCFRFPKKEAIGTFKHMWTNHAHVLDFEKIGEPQVCTITINFNADGHHYSFKRITKGEYQRDIDKKVEEDRIESINDILEIDNGAEILKDDDVQKDDVHGYLSRNFRFDQCAEYFCFDGEKAREVMMSSSNSSNINSLLGTINERITNPKLIEYEEKLGKLKTRIYSQSKSKLTNASLQNAINKIIDKETELNTAEGCLQDTIDKIRTLTIAIEQLDKEISSIESEITNTQSEILLKKTRLEGSLGQITRNIENKRGQIYHECLKWIKIEANDIVNKIKNNVKETGKLPEPYRKDLIIECLKGPVPTCQICGRELDKDSVQRVKELERMVATHEVHNFLSSEFSMNTNNFDSSQEDKELKKLIKSYNDILRQYNDLQLSDSDKKLIKGRDEFKADIKKLVGAKAQEEQSRDDIKIEIGNLKKEIDELRDKNASLKENRIILERIDKTLEIISEAKEKTKKIAIKIISDVISEGVSSILGPKFSACLTEKDGLLLGENGFFNTEAGGMSGRLILSYCFAEAMTLIDPIIVDTPAGNIGSHREALAKHLRANHRQVILLCLPTEIEDFAPYISSKNFIEIKNQAR